MTNKRTENYKSLAIKVDLHKQLLEYSQKTGLLMNRIVECAIIEYLEKVTK